jgi:hypothetical protein
MANTATASNLIGEMREFAGFAPRDQRYIKRSIDVGVRRNDAFELWARDAQEIESIRTQYLVYGALDMVRAAIPGPETLTVPEHFIGVLAGIVAFDLSQERLSTFATFRFLYERLLGAAVRPWLLPVFCAAAALPRIRPERRRVLLRSIPESAAIAGCWSVREPAFVPEWIETEFA